MKIWNKDKTMRDIKNKYDYLTNELNELYGQTDDYFNFLYDNIIDFYINDDPRLHDTIQDFYTRYYRLYLKEINGITNIEQDEFESKLIDYQW